jgi:hypothetical protein
MDGILGIGRGASEEGTVEGPQLIEVLTSNDFISSALYGLHLSRTSDGNNDGELNFGEPNKDRFDGDLNWLSQKDNDLGFWEVEISDAGAGDNMAGVKGKSAIIDSGTSYILMPEDDAVALHKLIDGYTQNGESFEVPCDTTTDMKIKLGPETYSISSADWVGNKGSSGACRSNIVGRQTFGDSQWLVGDTFLKNVYTVFDFDNSKIGFGVKDGSSSSSDDDDDESSSSASALPSSSATAGGSSSSPSASAMTSADPLLPPGSSSGPGSLSPTAAGDAAASRNTETGLAGRNEVNMLGYVICVMLGFFM